MPEDVEKCVCHENLKLEPIYWYILVYIYKKNYAIVFRKSKEVHLLLACCQNQDEKNQRLGLQNRKSEKCLMEPKAALWMRKHPQSIPRAGQIAGMGKRIRASGMLSACIVDAHVDAHAMSAKQPEMSGFSGGSY